MVSVNCFEWRKIRRRFKGGSGDGEDNGHGWMDGRGGETKGRKGFSLAEVGQAWKIANGGGVWVRIRD